MQSILINRVFLDNKYSETRKHILIFLIEIISTTFDDTHIL